jgi:uncharacterized phage protein gp47/JayE
MAITVKTPSEVGQEYLENLKTLRPEINTDQTDSDWWVKSRVIGGVVAGTYADISKVSNDAFPQSARREALEQHLQTYFNQTFKQPQSAVGTIAVSGSNGAVVSTGTQLTHLPTGNTYEVTSDLTLVGLSGETQVRSIATGIAQNLTAQTGLSFSTPPFGINVNAVVIGDGLQDGRDIETNEQAAERILARIRNPVRGGTESDYQQWALESDAAVVTAQVLRYPFGLGTVQLVIGSGTVNIDQAVDNGEDISFQPSNELIGRVKSYVEALNPLTDCLSVSGAQEKAIDVTVRVRFDQGDGSTIINSLGITQSEAVRREVKRALYKTPVGGRLFGLQGFVVASEIEEMIDFNLSKSPITTGVRAQIVVDRRVDALSVSGDNYPLLKNQVAVPGVINILVN